MKVLTLIATVLLFATLTAAQEPEKVCVSREAAEACVVADKKAKALEIELAVVTQALKDKDALIQKLEIDLARYAGENTALKQNAVSDRAIITAFIPMLRKKCLPLSICF